MSNFDFGAGPTQQSGSQGLGSQKSGLQGSGPQAFAPQGVGSQHSQYAAAPQQTNQPENPAQTESKPSRGGGITPVGLIALLTLLVVMLGVAWTGNRFYPTNSRIDSAWRGLEGNAAELSSYLRGQGFTCSDEAYLTGRHFHRLCAKYDETSHASIEFAGPPTGEVMRVHAEPGGAWTPGNRAAAERAIELSIPDSEAQRRAVAALAAGPASGQEVSGGWGRAGYDDTSFVVARTWTGPEEARLVVDGTERAAQVPARVAEAGYICTPGAAVMCRREANGARWTLTFDAAPGDPPASLSRVTLLGDVVDPESLDPAGELATVLPGGAFSPTNRLRWFVATADQDTGQAGFARNIRMAYRVESSGGTPTRVLIDARRPCRLDGTTPSC